MQETKHELFSLFSPQFRVMPLLLVIEVEEGGLANVEGHALCPSDDKFDPLKNLPKR